MYEKELTQANLDRLDDLRRRFAALTDYVAIYQSDWRAMAESGAVASIHIARYRGQKPLTASDLGLGDLDLDQVNRVIDLGQRVMLPKQVLNQFNSLEARARQVLRRYCLGTPFGLFLPASAYQGASTALGEYKARFDTLVADLLARLPEHKTTMLSEYAQLAYQVIGKEIGAANVTSDLVDAFVDRCMADFPSAETLQRSFAFGLRLEFIPALYQDAQVDQPSYAQASQDLINMRRAVIADQREARAALVDGFIDSVQGELFNLVNTALGDIYAALTKENSDSLPSRNVVQIKNLVKTIGDLNFWSDKRLEVIQAEILTLLPENRTTARRDMSMDASLVATLQDETKAILLRLTNGSNRAGFSLSEPSEAPAPIWTRTTRQIDLPSEAPAQDAPQASQERFDQTVATLPPTLDELYASMQASEAPRVLRPATDQDREFLTADSIVDGNVVVTPITRADVAKRRGARLF